MNESKKMAMYFVLLLTLFIIIFFTKSYYFSYIDNKENLDANIQKLEKLDNEISILQKNKKDLESGGSIFLDKSKKKKITKKYLEKYITDFNENDFLDYVYSLGDDMGVDISSLRLNKGKKDKNGFIKGTIDIKVGFYSEREMIDFLKKIIGKDAKYKFYIEDFTYPMGEGWEQEKKINIKLIIYYK